MIELWSNVKECDLPDAVSCRVTETLNSSFELVLEYPVVGEGFAEIALNKYIKCKPNPYDDAQLFRIYKISKAIGGTVTLYAEHISYSMNLYTTFPNSDYKDESGNAGDFMQYLNDCANINSAYSHKPTLIFTTDIDNSIKKTWSFDNHGTLKDAMQTAVSLFGGEWKFTADRCQLLASRGSSRGVSVTYGENMINMGASDDASAAYTHLMPFTVWTDSEGNKETIYTTNRFMPITSSDAAYFKPYVLDVSNTQMIADYTKYGDRPTSDIIEMAANEWLIYNRDAVGKCVKNYTLDVIQRGKTVEFAHLTDADHIELGDIIGVRSDIHGVNDSKKCVKVVYDVIADRIISVELGMVKRSIVDLSAKVEKEEAKKDAVSDNDSGNNGDEIPKSITKNSTNSVTFLYSDKSVTWTADGSGDTRSNFRKTITPINEGGDTDG